MSVPKIPPPQGIEHIKMESPISGKSFLDPNDFLTLIAAQLRYQDVMNPMSQSEMMNQLIQMTTIQAMTTMTDVTKTTYSASLVGKEVTVGFINDKDELEQLVGTVTGAAIYGGEQVIFVDDKTFYLSNIMAVGKIPESKDEDGDGDGEGEGGDGEDSVVNPQ